MVRCQPFVMCELDVWFVSCLLNEKWVWPLRPVGVLDTGVSWSTCSWAPSSAHLQPRGESMTQATEKTLTRRRLVRRTTTQTAKDQKTSSRAPAGEERNYNHVSSARLRVEQEDNGQKTAYRPRYPYDTPTFVNMFKQSLVRQQ
jgi:hypothetical protein